MSSHSVTPDIGEKSNINVLDDFHILQCKEDGRRIYYGPTSVKTFMAKSKWGMLERFRQTWCVVKVTRSKWKKLNGRNMIDEIKCIERHLQSSNPLLCNSLQDACHALPPYEKIRSHIELFFQDKVLFQISDVIDQEKVLKDFFEEFVPDKLSCASEQRVISLCPVKKKNYYKIGVILMILGFTYFYETIPETIQKFLILLTGISTAKCMYIERAQFLMLRLHHLSRYSSTGEDNNNEMIIVDSLINTSSLLGLNHNISVLYDGQEDLVGNLSTLTKLRDWVLFADVQMAFQLGRPLLISATELDYYNDSNNIIGNPLETTEPSFYSLFRKFLRISRCIISEIHDKAVVPNLKKMCATLTEFIEQYLHPISDYTSPCSMKKEYICETGILFQILSMLLSLYNLRYLAFSEMSVGLKNSVIKTSLVSLSLCTCLTSYCFEQDAKNFPGLFQSNSKHVAPYFSLSLSLSSELSYRALITFYALVYNTLTLSQSGLICSAGEHSVKKCDLKTLHINETANISFSVYFKVFCEIVNRMSNNENARFRQLSRRSYAFVTMLTLANSCRNTIKKTLENKDCEKKPWISPLQQFPSLEFFEKNVYHTLESRHYIDPSTPAHAIEEDSNPPLVSQPLESESTFEGLLHEISTQQDVSNFLFDENFFSENTQSDI